MAALAASLGGMCVPRPRAMGPLSQGTPSAWILAALTLTLLPASGAVLAADLKPATLAAYERYVQAAETQVERRRAAGRFLRLYDLPPDQRGKTLAEIRRGEIFVEPVDLRDANGKPFDIPDGMVHHWVGAAFIPRATLAETTGILFNYEHYRDIYKPEVVGSRLISRSNGDLKVFLRLQKRTSWSSVTYDCDYEVHYRQNDEHRAFSHTRAIRIQQVEEAGRPGEHKDPVGHDSGYLWGINTFWAADEGSDGVIIEWEFITLSREIPFLLHWVVRPFIARLARETVANMLTNTRATVQASLKTGAGAPVQAGP